MEKSWYRGVVVGVDGSGHGMAALDWAARTADRHGARLTALACYVVPSTPAVAAAGFSVADARDDAVYAIDQAIHRLRGMRPGDRDVDARVVMGAAAHVLAQESRSCDLVVVGRRGLGRLDRALLGSTSSALAATAPGVVAVVPSGASTGDPRRVVVGVGTDDDPDPALGAAFAEAEARGCRLEVVHVLAPVGVTDVLDGSASGAVWREASAADVAHRVARWAEKYPRVPATVTLRTGEAATVLARGLRADDLVVVGGERHPLALGRLLRSVPDQLLRMAPCPVLVVHAQR